MQTGVTGALIREKKSLTTARLILAEANSELCHGFSVSLSSLQEEDACASEFPQPSPPLGSPLLSEALVLSGDQHNQWQDALTERKGGWLCAWPSGSSASVQTVPSKERHDQNDKRPRTLHTLPAATQMHTVTRDMNSGARAGGRCLESPRFRHFASSLLFRWKCLNEM